MTNRCKEVIKSKVHVQVLESFRIIRLLLWLEGTVLRLFWTKSSKVLTKFSGNKWVKLDGVNSNFCTGCNTMLLQKLTWEDPKQELCNYSKLLYCDIVVTMGGRLLKWSEISHLVEQSYCLQQADCRQRIENIVLSTVPKLQLSETSYFYFSLATCNL